jgi:two-component system sensor histidine kinase YesM
MGMEDSGVTVCRKVTRDGRTIGYVMLNINQRALAEILPAAGDIDIRYAVADHNHFLALNQFMNPRSPFIPERYRPFARTMDRQLATMEYRDEKYMISGCVLPGTDLALFAELSTALMIRNSAFITWTVVGVTLLFSVICIFVAHKIARRILDPIRTICNSMEIIKDGNLHERVSLSTHDEFETMAEGFNRMIDQLNDQFTTGIERQKRLRIAEIKNLQAQIAPHFLYNTLESIKWLAKLGMNDEIKTIVEKLGILLKSGMNFKEDMIPLKDEMRVVNSYIAIQQIRYEDQFTVRIDIEESLLDCMVPNLVIQPIVENALVHGIENKIGGGILEIRGRSSGGDMHIEIRDSGNGIGEDQLKTLLNDDGGNKSESIGLINVDQRLKLYFGPDYGLLIQSEQGEGTAVTVTMPVRLQRESDV